MSTATSDPLAEFKDLSQPVRPRCSVSDVLTRLDAAEAALLDQALRDEDITHSAISQWLARREVKVSGTTIGRHRGGRCSCDV